LTLSPPPCGEGRRGNAAKYFSAVLAADKVADAAYERAFHQDCDLRFRIRHKIPIFICTDLRVGDEFGAAAEITPIGFLARNTATMQGPKCRQLLTRFG
jgi:hypothetical protein